MRRALQPHLGSHATFLRRRPSILIPVILGAGVGSPSSAPLFRLSAAFRDMNGIVLFVCFNDVSNQDLGETEEGNHRSLEAVCDLGRCFFIIRKSLHSATSPPLQITRRLMRLLHWIWRTLEPRVADCHHNKMLGPKCLPLSGTVRARIGSLRLHRLVRIRRMTLNDR